MKIQNKRLTTSFTQNELVFFFNYLLSHSVFEHIFLFAYDPIKDTIFFQFDVHYFIKFQIQTINKMTVKNVTKKYL